MNQRTQSTLPSQPPSQQNGIQMNRTVQGVAAALYGIIRRTHEELLPSSTLKTMDPLFAIFENKKLVPSTPATIQEHIKTPQPDFLRVYKVVYSLFRRAQIEPECLIAALVYFERFLEAATPNRLLFTALNWERITFTNLMIASKAWDDVSCSTKSFAICSNNTITVSELCLMERIILQHLDYRLYLTADIYRVVYYDLKKFWVNMVVDEKGAVVPAKYDFVQSLGIPERWAPHLVFLSGPASTSKASSTTSLPFSSVSASASDGKPSSSSIPNASPGAPTNVPSASGATPNSVGKTDSTTCASDLQKESSCGQAFSNSTSSHSLSLHPTTTAPALVSASSIAGDSSS